MSALAYLSRLCCRWGGRLVLLPGRDFDALGIVKMRGDRTLGPDGRHAIDITKLTVYAVADSVNPGTVCHEMGHIFLVEAHPNSILRDEPAWLGWEIRLAERAGCFDIWSAQNADYELTFEGRIREWGDLDTGERGRLIADRIAYAKQIGIVSRRGEPLCTRRAT